MNKFSLLGVAVSLACCAALAAEPRTFSYVADSFSINDSTEEATVKGMTLDLGKTAQLSAESASFQISTNPVPRVVELEGVQIKAGDQVVGWADSAVFYPELRAFTTDAYYFYRNPVPMESSSVTVTTMSCRGGVLYENGQPVPQGTCFNMYGGGSRSHYCSGDGNQLMVIHSDQACPLD